MRRHWSEPNGRRIEDIRAGHRQEPRIHIALLANADPVGGGLHIIVNTATGDALYMPALVAMRFNPDLKTKYEELRAAGKPAKVAIVAVMRELIETANALVKADRTWTPKTA